MSFEQWKARLEEKAHTFNDEDASRAEAQRQERLAFQFLCKTLMDGADNTLAAGVPEETVAEMMDERMSIIIDDAATKCKNMIRETPEQREALMDYWENYLDFFKGWRETVRGNNPDCLLYSELKQKKGTK